MGKRVPLSITIFLVACAALVSFQITYNYVNNKYASKQAEMVSGKAAFAKMDTIDAIVRKSYVGEINEKQLEDGIIQGYLYGLGDKYATYLTKDEYMSYTSKRSGKMVGIGIKVIYDNTLGGIYVTNVVKDSPALTAGLCAGDLITAVDGLSIAERGYYNTITYISSGSEGDVVTLKVLKGPDFYSEAEYVIERAVVSSPTVTSEQLPDNVGLVTITEFTKNTPAEFTSAVEELRRNGSTSLVFDLRNNPGGDLDGIRGVLDYLLPEGPIIRIISKDGSEQVLSSDAACVELPMAVVVNGNTASAAELFTSALKDYKKATVVGATTYGKGTMQTMMQLADGSALSVSTQMYNPPYSENYEGKGVVPDLVVELSAEQLAQYYMLTPENDPQLSKAIGVVKSKRNLADAAVEANQAETVENTENTENAENAETTEAADAAADNSEQAQS